MEGNGGKYEMQIIMMNNLANIFLISLKLQVEYKYFDSNHGSTLKEIKRKRRNRLKIISNEILIFYFRSIHNTYAKAECNTI